MGVPNRITGRWQRLDARCGCTQPPAARPSVESVRNMLEALAEARVRNPETATPARRSRCSALLGRLSRARDSENFSLASPYPVQRCGTRSPASFAVPLWLTRTLAAQAPEGVSHMALALARVRGPARGQRQALRRCVPSAVPPPSQGCRANHASRTSQSARCL